MVAVGRPCQYHWDMTNNERDTAVITGGNTGMGKSTALALAEQGYRVIMLCRNEAKGLAARDDIRSASGNQAVELVPLDLASFASIRQAAARVLEIAPRIQVLVNNAGVITTDRRETADGHELQFGVNHLGHFLLTTLLLPALRAAAPARIVVVCSGAHKIGRIDFDDIPMRRSFSIFRAYSRSKLANLLFASQLARRLEGSGVTDNAVHPGAVGTEMGVDRQTGFGGGLMAFLRPFFLTPAQGATTAIWLATAPELAGLTGGYYYRKKPAKPSRLASDPALQAKLWEVSETLVGETFG